MKFNVYFFSVIVGLILFSLSCNDDGCQNDRQNIESLKATYENSPSEANCLAYAGALQSYLSKNCDNPDQIFYDRIFESYLSELDCANVGTINPTTDTCNDGIQNGDETGVDCGGSICPPCPPAPTPTTYIRFDIDGVNYVIESSNTSGDAGNSPSNNYVFSQGNITDGGDFGALEIHFFQAASINLSNFQGLIGFPIAFNNSGNSNFGNVELNLGGTTYNSDGAGNTAGNSQLIVLQASVEDDTPETYRIRGIFNCEVVDGTGNATTLENGTFELIFDSLN